METIPIKTTCQACQGARYLPTDKAYIPAGCKGSLVAPCTACNGTGKEIQQVDLQDFANMLFAIAAEKQTA